MIEKLRQEAQYNSIQNTEEKKQIQQHRKQSEENYEETSRRGFPRTGFPSIWPNTINVRMSE